jgi:hypothetical protein
MGFAHAVKKPAASGIHLVFVDGMGTVDVTSMRDVSNNKVISGQCSLCCLNIVSCLLTGCGGL